MFFGSGIGMDAAGYRMQEALFRAIGTPAKFSPLTIDGTAKTLVAHLVGGFPGFTSHVDYDAHAHGACTSASTRSCPTGTTSAWPTRWRRSARSRSGPRCG